MKPNKLLSAVMLGSIDFVELLGSLCGLASDPTVPQKNLAGFFPDREHRLVFMAMMAVDLKGQPIDIVTLAHQLKDFEYKETDRLVSLVDVAGPIGTDGVTEYVAALG